jgi:hypothetical protein
VHDGNSGSPCYQLGQARPVRGNYQHRRSPVGGFCLFGLLYCGCGDHRIHSLPRRHVRGADQVTRPLPYRFGDRLDGDASQHATHLSIPAGPAKELSQDRRGRQYPVTIFVGNL